MSKPQINPENTGREPVQFASPMPVEKELDRILTLLRNKIREKGFTQLEVQDALGWGRSYISQLLTKQKSLRVEQVLLILGVIGVDPADFFGELYHYMPMDRGIRNIDEYVDRAGLRGGFQAQTEEIARAVEQLQDTVQGVVRLLAESAVVPVDKLDDLPGASVPKG